LSSSPQYGIKPVHGVFFIISAFLTPSIKVLSSIGIGTRSIGTQGLKPYTTSNGQNS